MHIDCLEIGFKQQLAVISKLDFQILDLRILDL